MDDVVDHLGGAGAFATARDFASVLLLFINEGRHRTSIHTDTKLPELARIVFDRLLQQSKQR